MRSAYTIVTTRRFQRDFDEASHVDLSPTGVLTGDLSVARRIMKKIDHLAAHPELVSQPLRNPPPGLEGVHKYRVGDYRILLWADHHSQVLTLHAVAHRSEIYRNL